MLQAGLEDPAALAKREVLLCGADQETKELIRGLLEPLGLRCVDAGPLLAARYAEPAMFLLVHLAYVVGLGELTMQLVPANLT